MERKAGTSTAAVTAVEVRAAMGKARTLSSEEEKGLRMRYGIQEELGAPLPRASGGNAELEDELTLIQMQLTRAFRAQQAQGGGRSAVAPGASRTKDKIVRALRKKK